MMNDRTKGRKAGTVCNNLHSLVIEESEPIGELS